MEMFLQMAQEKNRKWQWKSEGRKAVELSWGKGKLGAWPAQIIFI